MVEGSVDGQESGCRSKPASSFESGGGRLRFRVELRPGETTIVSWKKLLKEATSNKPKGPDSSVVVPYSEAPQPVPQPPVPPASLASSSKQPATENETKDAQGQSGPNRLSNVIERIERMYAGDGSSDEEDVVLDDVPDDDEYDTDDSFIDDAELDDYFQVDNSAIKHDGFFVNRGKLERIEPTTSESQQPKKRRRKDLTKGPNGSDDGHNPNKHVKIGDKGKKASSIERKSVSQANRVAVPVQSKDIEFQAFPTKVPEIPSKRKIVGSKSTMSSLGLSNGDAIGQGSNADQQRTGVLSSDNHHNKQKEDNELQDTPFWISSDKILYEHKYQSENFADEINQSTQQKEKVGHVERFDLNVPAHKDSLHTVKVPPMHRKEGSSVRPKTTMLDKALRDLEKIVAESRPPSTEVQDTDNSSQAIKRRLTPEIKQKLAKVARVTVSYGKIPKEVISRLMSIVGHLMQLRTLKRNLKIMANVGLSLKQEKDNQVQRIKQEVADMVKLRILYMESKVDQQTASSDDFQEAGPRDRESLKQKYSVDNALGKKICELFDLYVEKLEEGSGPPVKKLYEELAALWPSGGMDTDVIKRAVHRAKERRAVSNRQKDQEKIKKVSCTKTDTVQGEATGVSPVSHHEKLPSALRENSTSTSKPNVSAPIALPPARVSVSLANDPNTDKPKQEKIRGNSSRNLTDSRPMDVVPKKKVKRKPDIGAIEGQLHLEKVTTQAEDRHKQHKPMAAPITKSNLLPAAPSNSELPN